MTQLAFRLGYADMLAVDPARLYYGDDPTYENWLWTVLDMVNIKRREDTPKTKS